MLRQLWAALRRLIDFSPVRLAIVRRYQDANGHNVGELYLELPDKHGYRMVGVSLDSLPLDYTGGKLWKLDTSRDFLALPMPRNTVRVGAADPENNDFIRDYVAGLPRWNMSLMVQNRFIEHVLERETGR
jgi:hypothetical protein